MTGVEVAIIVGAAGGACAAVALVGKLLIYVGNSIYEVYYNHYYTTDTLTFAQTAPTCRALLEILKQHGVLKAKHKYHFDLNTAIGVRDYVVPNPPFNEHVCLNVNRLCARTLNRALWHVHAQCGCSGSLSRISHLLHWIGQVRRRVRRRTSTRVGRAMGGSQSLACGNGQENGTSSTTTADGQDAAADCQVLQSSQDPRVVQDVAKVTPLQAS